MSVQSARRLSWSPSLGAWPDHEQTHFRVWAPKAKTVSAVIERPNGPAQTAALARDGEGYFSVALPRFPAGTLYRYSVDGRGPFPDPASRRQPHGVHGPSMIVDPAFDWTDEAWPGCSQDRLVFYELHVGTFTPQGTFAAAQAKLPQLKELGVTAVELMPVADFPGRWNWGYDGVSLFAPARCYGTPEDLRAFVNAAHRLGLAVFMDVVYNHLGPDGNYLGVYSDFYFTDRHQSPWGAGVNLDGEHSGPVRSFFIENAQHWIHEYHMDGLRLDATHAMVDEGPRHFLAELSDQVRRSSPERRVFLVAEDSRNLAVMIRPESEKGWGMDAVWADDFHHQMRRFLAGDHEGYFESFAGTVKDIAATIQNGWFFKDAGNRPYPQYVICIQNHDQIGNRAFGDRLTQSVDEAAFRAASAVLLFAPETPLLFMGQEWGASTPFLFFTDHNPELGKRVTEGRRKEFKNFSAFTDPKKRETIPDPQSPSTFEASRLKWEELSQAPHRDLWRLTQALLRLRQDHPVFRAVDRGHTQAAALTDSILAVRRWSDAGELLLVACLRGGGSADIGSLSAARRERLRTHDSGWRIDGNAIAFDHPAAVVLER